MMNAREVRRYAAAHRLTRMQARVALLAAGRVLTSRPLARAAYVLPPQPPGTLRMEQWSVGFADPYRAPEVNAFVARGHVVGRPDPSGKGHRMQTSAIVASEGRVITTSSGSRYFLAEPDPDYVEWLRGEGKTIDEEQPVKLLRRVEAA